MAQEPIDARSRFMEQAFLGGASFDELQQLRKGEFHFAPWHIRQFLTHGSMEDPHNNAPKINERHSRTFYIPSYQGEQWVRDLQQQLVQLQTEGVLVQIEEQEDAYGKKVQLVSRRLPGEIRARVQITFRHAPMRSIDTLTLDHIKEKSVSQQMRRGVQLPFENPAQNPPHS